MTMFSNLDMLPSKSDVLKIEFELGIRFPSPLRRLFLENNGGEPEPYVYQDANLNTIVNETLPLVSSCCRTTAVDTYKVLISNKKLLSSNFFPFAVDPGGDYFFIDCNTEDAQVFFYKHDSYFDRQNPLVDIKMGLESFWASLKPEEQQRRLGKLRLIAHVTFRGNILMRKADFTYNYFRYYDPGIGRYISPDPIGLLDGHNEYSYSPNVWGWIDPLGLCEKELSPTNYPNPDPSMDLAPVRYEPKSI